VSSTFRHLSMNSATFIGAKSNESAGPRA
jgi:hypothetical protein